MNGSGQGRSNRINAVLFPWRQPNFSHMAEKDQYRLKQKAIVGWFSLISIVLGIAFILAAIIYNQRNDEKNSAVNETDWNLLGASCPSRPINVEDRRHRKDQLSIATFNAEWLFRWGGSGTRTCPGKACPWKTEADADKHVHEIASMIYNLDADIVHLAELESCKILGYLLSKMPAKDHRYKQYMVAGRDTITGQNVGILTRIDPSMDLTISTERVATPVIGSICESRTVGKTICTKHYVTRFDIPIGNQNQTIGLTMAGVHFLAGPRNQQKCTRREGQAVVVKNIVAKVKGPNDALVIVGDFNDFDNSVLGADDETSISATMPIVLNAVSDYTLVNTAKYIPHDQRYSAWHDKNRNCKDDGIREHALLDHILVSPGTSYPQAYTLDNLAYYQT